MSSVMCFFSCFGEGYYFYHSLFYTMMIGFFVFLFGLLLGSFSSAVSYRIVRGESWIISEKGEAARSRCPQCAHQLGFFDLIPLFSWVLLRGKCRYCSTPISARYPVLEAVSGSIFLGYYLVSGYYHPLAFNILFAVCLPFFLAFAISYYESCEVRYFTKFPVLWITGLLSVLVMVSLVFYPVFLH